MSRDPPSSPSLREHLASSNTPCVGCGYNLRGVETVNCPECGTVIPRPSAMVEPEPDVPTRVPKTFAILTILGAIVIFELLARHLRARPGAAPRSVIFTSFCIVFALAPALVSIAAAIFPEMWGAERARRMILFGLCVLSLGAAAWAAFG